VQAGAVIDKPTCRCKSPGSESGLHNWSTKSPPSTAFTLQRSRASLLSQRPGRQASYTPNRTAGGGRPSELHTVSIQPRSALSARAPNNTPGIASPRPPQEDQAVSPSQRPSPRSWHVNVKNRVTSMFSRAVFTRTYSYVASADRSELAAWDGRLHGYHGSQFLHGLQSPQHGSNLRTMPYPRLEDDPLPPIRADDGRAMKHSSGHGFTRSLCRTPDLATSIFNDLTKTPSPSKGIERT